MRIKVLRTIGRKDTLPRSNETPTSLELPAKPDGSMYQEGEVAEFKKDEAEKFIETGMGEQTDEPVGLPPKAVLDTNEAKAAAPKPSKGEK